MNATIRTIAAICVKDLVSEFRTREVLPTMIVLGMLIAWVMRLIAEVGALSATVVGPAALWVALLFSGLLAQDHAFEVEQREHCIAGLLLAPVDAGAIFLAKLIVALATLGVFELVFVPMAVLAFGMEALSRAGHLLLVLTLINVALSAVGTLFSAMVRVSQSRSSLLNILVLVILLPMMIPATYALLWSLGIIAGGVAATSTLALASNFRLAVGYLAVFDAVFVTASWLLFGFVVQE